MAAHSLLDAVDHRQLGSAPLGLFQQALRLVEEARVFQRHAHAGGQGFEQAHLGLAVGMLAAHVAELDQSACLVARHQRHHQLRPGFRHVRHQLGAVGSTCLVHAFIDDERLAGAQDVGAEALVTHGLVGEEVTLVVVVGVRIALDAGRTVVRANAHERAGKYFAQLFAHRVVYARHAELAGQRLLHGVDDRELGRTLLQQGVRGLQLLRTLRHLLFESL